MRKSALLGFSALLVPVVAFAAEDRPSGIRVGAFIVTPSVTLEETYDSNIFLEESGVTDTFLTTIAPRLTIDSNWNRHALRLDAGVEAGFFTHSSDDDYIDYDASLLGVLDITRNSYISGGFGYAQRHEARGSVDVPGLSAEPVDFETFTGNILGEVSPGRFRFQAFANAEYSNFDDVPLVGGGSSNEDDRDRYSAETGVEVGYSVRFGYEAFVRGSYLWTEYDDAVDDTGVNRDSTGFKVLGGLKVDLTRLIEASVGAGYQMRSYDDPSLGDLSTYAVDAEVSWFVTPITKILLNASHNIEETTLAGASGAAATRAEIGVNHELRRNLSVRAAGGFDYVDYDGTSRNDQLYSAGLGVDWRITPRLTLGPSYEFRLRNSNAAGSDFTDHRVNLAIKYGF